MPSRYHAGLMLHKKGEHEAAIDAFSEVGSCRIHCTLLSLTGLGKLCRSWSGYRMTRLSLSRGGLCCRPWVITKTPLKISLPHYFWWAKAQRMQAKTIITEESRYWRSVATHSLSKI